MCASGWIGWLKGCGWGGSSREQLSLAVSFWVLRDNIHDRFTVERTQSIVAILQLWSKRVWLQPIRWRYFLHFAHCLYNQPLSWGEFPLLAQHLGEKFFFSFVDTTFSDRAALPTELRIDCWLWTHPVLRVIYIDFLNCPYGHYDKRHKKKTKK